MKKPTNSAAFFGKDENKPHKQLTPVMEQLTKVLPPGAKVPETPQQNLDWGGQVSNSSVVIEVDLPGEPPPIIDNALSLPGLEKVKNDPVFVSEEKPVVGAIDGYPSYIYPPENIAKPARKEHPAPTIAELPVIELTDEMKEFLLWFKDRANTDNIKDPARDHATYGPSSAERDIHCIASMPLTYIVRRDRPKEDRSSYADEGHLAHEVAAVFVAAKFENRPYPFELFTGKQYKPDMFRYAQDYAEYCFKACQPYSHLPSSWVIEERVCIDYVRDSWGTLDFAFVARDGDKLYAVIVDYKYGMGVEVTTQNG